jgi:hypothetical protein
VAVTVVMPILILQAKKLAKTMAERRRKSGTALK